MNECYTDYQSPISEMQRLSKLTKPFKLEFKKVDGTKRIIYKALLRGQSQSNQDKNGPYKIQFFDVDNEQMGSCYIPFILALNDKKILLNGKGL